MVPHEKSHLSFSLKRHFKSPSHRWGGKVSVLSPQCPSPHHPTTIEPSIHPITVVHHHTIPPPSSLLSIPSLLSIEPSIHPTIVVRHLASMTNQKRLSFARSVLSKAMAPLWPRGSGSAERRRLEQAHGRFMLRRLSAADLELVDQKTVPACWSPELVRESWAAPVGACDSKHLSSRAQEMFGTSIKAEISAYVKKKKENGSALSTDRFKNQS